MIEKLNKVGDLNILVVGDIILDEYIFGTSERISPEAPVPIVSITETENVLGGAANVASNLANLGAQIHLLGFVGGDESGRKVMELLEKIGIDTSSICEFDRPTTTKTRIVSKGQQMIRIDNEVTNGLPIELENEIFHQVKAHIESENYNGIILQDYNKGLFTSNIIGRIMRLARNHELPIFVDPKFKNFWSYTEATLFKPNLKEIIDANSGRFGSDVENILVQSAERLNCELLICTMAEKGIAYVKDSEYFVQSTERIDVVDVSGAGDTALAVMTIAYLIGCTPEEIAQLANLGGKLVCLKSGVSTITIDELKDAYLRSS